MQKCVFLVETGLRYKYGQRGTQAIIEIPLARRIFRIIIGGVLAFDVMNVSIRELGNMKKRKVMGATKRKVPRDAASFIQKRTTAGHYVQFISDTLDIMDIFLYMKGFHIVMNNILIHCPDLADPVIIERSCVPVYLLPYQTNLKSIKMFESHKSNAPT